jgi:hypothetical protein
MPDAPDIEEPTPVLPDLPKGRRALPLEDYVAEAVRGARIAGELALTKSNDEDVEARVKAAEAYARWRHGAYLAGQVVSL